MGVPGKPFHEKPPLLTDERVRQPARGSPPVATRIKAGPEAGYPGASPEIVDAAFAGDAAPSGAIESSPQWRQFFDICRRIQGFPRHLSIHVGGMLVTGEPLIDMLPVERATMPGRVVVQFNKDDVEDLGLIKMDMLGLRTLSVVEECLELAHGGDRRAPRPRRPRPQGPRGLPHRLGGRHRGRLPDRVAGADGDPAPDPPRQVHRPRGGGGDHPPRPDPGQRRQPLHPPPPGPGAGHLPPPQAGADPEGHPGRDPLPGADPGDRDGAWAATPRPRPTASAGRWTATAQAPRWRRCATTS